MSERTILPTQGRSRTRLARLLLFFGSILVALLVAEVALRVYGFSHFNPYIVDADLGFSLRPNAEGWWRIEALTYVRINSQGFRDREHDFAKPAGTLRVAVIGDSFTEAFQVPQEKTFWSVMERRLQSCAPPEKVEVLSFGVSGYSTARELILLQERVWQYSPDVVILQVTTGNDIRDNSPLLGSYRNEPLPYFVFNDGKLIRDDSRLLARNRTRTFRLQQSFFGAGFNWLRRHVRVIGLLDMAREAYHARGDKSAGEPSWAGKELGITSEVYREPLKPEWNEAWRVTEGLLQEMHAEVETRGAKFLVVTGSMGIQVHPDAAVRREFSDRLGVQNLFYPDERIKDFGTHNNFQVLNLAPALADYASRNHVFLHGFGATQGRGHWNENGHQLAGELVAQEVCRVLR
jgi:hypothetical protein